ncbi:MAG: response regulator [Elusimicrobia bacterium]|nr:response regulator [Elusimicrobiota bacterium]
MARILIVDDNNQNRYILEVALKGAGHEVASARNGVEALESARKAPPELVISDILMPVMDGYELCRRWKADERLKDAPFIFYTATYTDPRDEQLGLRLGADRFVVKLAELELLRDVVREVLEKRRQGQAAAPAEPQVKEEEALQEHSAAVLRKLQKKQAQLASEVAARRSAEEALLRSEERLRRIIKMAPVAMGLVARSGEMCFLNDRFVALFGYTIEDIPTFEDWVLRAYPDEDYRRRIVPPWLEAAEHSARFGDYFPSAMYEVTCKDKTVRSVEISGITLGEHILATFVDHTERKRAEKDNALLEEEARQAQKMESVGRLAGGVAHDFNNMLSAINGYAQLLQQSLPPDDPRRADAEQILAAGARAAVLTRQLLAFSRRQVLQPRVLDLNNAVSDMTNILKRLLGEDIVLETRLAARPCLVKVDAGQIDQVLLNLAVNARDAMPGGGTLTVATNAAATPDGPGLPPGPAVVLSFSDTGLGMSEEVLSHIFEPFFTTKEPGKGTGLGLPTVFGIVKQSGGDIRVKSAPGRGASFSIYLPQAEPEAAPEPRDAGPQPLPRGQETLLFVEDEEAVRNLARRALTAHGYQVLAAADGPQALAALERHGRPVDLLVTDLLLPGGMNGRELARAVAARGLAPKVLFMSGFPDDTVLKDGLLEPGLSLLLKPLTPESLLRQLREVLDGPAAQARA